MNAVILAGGFGSRLKPLTDTTPKPLLPIANVPMLDYAVAHLYALGVTDTVFTLGYFPDKIRSFTQGYRAVRSHCLVEDTPLGTAGGVKAAQKYLDDTFIVISGDALENIDFTAMLQCHKHSGKLVTMAVTHVDDARAFGLVQYDASGTVTAFTEKPAERMGGTVNCGVYMIERRVLSMVPEYLPYDFSRDLFPRLVQESALGVYEHDGYWSDLGTPQAYYDANFYAMQHSFFPPVYNRNRPLSCRRGQADPSLCAVSALIAGKCTGCIVGENATIATSAVLERCVVMPGVTVRGRYNDCIVGEDFAVSMLPLVRNRHDMTQISENFS